MAINKTAPKIRQGFIYTLAALLIFVAPIFVQFHPLPTLTPELIHQVMAKEKISKPQFIYFWANWCGVCQKMQSPISTILKDYNGVTVAVSSGNAEQVQSYLDHYQLIWPTVNDEHNEIGEQFLVKAVPTIFIFNQAGEIAFVDSGYVSVYGLRLRLWLASSSSFKKITLF
ncbi:MAG: redoxin domain-containing protein [Methylococcales bacterium]|nr:redoxin domain-containing protein [Methylococcales bacterium]